MLSVTQVSPRSNGTVRVRGLASSGRYASNGYGPYGVGAYGALGYGYANAADLQLPLRRCARTARSTTSASTAANSAGAMDQGRAPVHAGALFLCARFSEGSARWLCNHSRIRAFKRATGTNDEQCMKSSAADDAAQQDLCGRLRRSLRLAALPMALPIAARPAAAQAPLRRRDRRILPRPRRRALVVRAGAGNAAASS